MMHFSIEDAWTSYHASKTLKQSTVIRDVNRYNRHLLPYWQGKAFDVITTQDILAYKRYLIEQNLSPQSIKHCLTLFRAIMKRSIQLELYNGKVPYFEMPKFDNRRLRYLTEGEASALLLALKAKNELWHDISLFALNTGMRAGEIFNIRTNLINLPQKSITLFETKNALSRTVPLNEAALDVVCKYSQYRLNYLFSNKKMTDVAEVFRNVVKETDLNKNVDNERNKIVFHSLRHTFASWLVQKGVPLVVVSNLLGHKTTQMTMRYAHLAPKQGHDAVSLLPKL